jgi:DNA polymerase III epsilon subunit-like protein
MLDFTFALFENNKDVASLSADNLLRGFMGYDKGKGHDAMEDVIMTAELFCRVMKMIRAMASKKNFKGSMASSK